MNPRPTDCDADALTTLQSRRLIYVMSHIEFEILEKFSKHFVRALIYRLHGEKMRANLYIDVGSSRREQIFVHLDQ